VRPSTSRSSTIPPEAVPVAPVAGGFPVVLTVDVEEWFHNCFVPEYVDPGRRPPLAPELDRTLPELLALLDELGARATLFVLGEVARGHPARIREAHRAGHEIACHGDLHLRANVRSAAAFEVDIRRAKETLEDLVGSEVVGFRSPEWSLRRADNPRFRRVAEAGFRYDSSLAPSIGSGAARNPRGPVRYRYDDGLELLELPPLGDAPPGEWSPFLRADRLREGGFGWWQETHGKDAPALELPEHPFEVRCRLVLKEVPGVVP
jgi:hypothetical protein